MIIDTADQKEKSVTDRSIPSDVSITDSFDRLYWYRSIDPSPIMPSYARQRPAMVVSHLAMRRRTAYICSVSTYRIFKKTVPTVITVCTQFFLSSAKLPLC
jgi:hypothetical protein